MRELKSQVAQIFPGGAGHGRRKRGMEMTDDRAREDGRGEKTCEERERRRLRGGSERLGVKKEA